MARTTRPDHSKSPAPDPEDTDVDIPSETRRDTVRRLGKYATYTAPALIALLTATTSASAS